MTTITLPAVLDRPAAQSLASEISDAMTQRENVELDGAGVTKIGQVGLQLLLSATVTATHRGSAVKVANPSEVLLTALNITKAVDYVGIGTLDNDK